MVRQEGRAQGIWSSKERERGRESERERDEKKKKKKKKKTEESGHLHHGGQVVELLIVAVSVLDGLAFGVVVCQCHVLLLAHIAHAVVGGHKSDTLHKPTNQPTNQPTN
jgi:hypothetical protein